MVTPPKHAGHDSKLARQWSEKRQKDFLDWLRLSGEWMGLEKRWADQARGPWSLPLFFTRAYARFSAQHSPPTSKRRPHPLSELSSTILASVETLAESLAPAERLCLSLHWEGLVDGEISRLLRLSPETVAERVRFAKETIAARARGQKVGHA